MAASARWCPFDAAQDAYQPLSTAAAPAVADHLRVDAQRELRVGVAELLRTHLKHVYRKLGVHDRTAAAIVAVGRGCVAPSWLNQLISRRGRIHDP